MVRSKCFGRTFHFRILKWNVVINKQKTGHNFCLPDTELHCRQLLTKLTIMVFNLDGRNRRPHNWVRKHRMVTSHNVWSQCGRHFVGITRHNVCSQGAKIPITLNQWIIWFKNMPIWSLTYQPIIFKRCHIVTNISKRSIYSQDGGENWPAEIWKKTASLSSCVCVHLN